MRFAVVVNTIKEMEKIILYSVDNDVWQFTQAAFLPLENFDSVNVLSSTQLRLLRTVPIFVSAHTFCISHKA